MKDYKTKSDSDWKITRFEDQTLFFWYSIVVFNKKYEKIDLGDYSVDIEKLVTPVSNSGYFTCLIFDWNIQKPKITCTNSME